MVRVILVVEVVEEVGVEDEDRDVVVETLAEGVVERQRVEEAEKLAFVMEANPVMVGNVGKDVAVEHREAVGKAEGEVVVVMVTEGDTDLVLNGVRV